MRWNFVTADFHIQCVGVAERESPRQKKKVASDCAMRVLVDGDGSGGVRVTSPKKLAADCAMRVSAVVECEKYFTRIRW